MWARIDDNSVAEITDIDPSGRFHSSIQWVECPEEVKQGWLYDGSEFQEPEPEPVPVPQQVSRSQGKTILIQEGLWSQVISYIENMEDGTERLLAEVALNDTTHWRRDSPFLNKFAEELSISEEQMDDMFTRASKIAL